MNTAGTIQVYWMHRSLLHSPRIAVSLHTISSSLPAKSRMRTESVAARVMLYRLLPGAVGSFSWFISNLNYTPEGKPFTSYSPYAFSISHSKHILLVALTTLQSIGADVVTPGNIKEQYAPYFLHPDECASGKKEESKRDWLDQIWAKKEAWSKLTGMGWSAGFRQLNTIGRNTNSKENRSVFFHPLKLDNQELGFACTYEQTDKIVEKQVQEMQLLSWIQATKKAEKQF